MMTGPYPRNRSQGARGQGLRSYASLPDLDGTAPEPASLDPLNEESCSVCRRAFLSPNISTCTCDRYPGRRVCARCHHGGAKNEAGPASPAPQSQKPEGGDLPWQSTGQT